MINVTGTKLIIIYDLHCFKSNNKDDDNYNNGNILHILSLGAVK